MNRFIYLLLCGVLAGCQYSHNYTVNGKIEHYEGRILLLSPQALGNCDTLGNIVTSDGSFTFTGVCDQLVIAEIVPVNTRLRIPVFLENEEYKVEINLKKPQEYLISGGGQLQELRNQFRLEELKIKDYCDSMRIEYEKLYDTKTNFGRLQVKTLLAQLDTLYDQAEERFIQQYDNVVSASLIYYRMNQLFERKCLHQKYELLGEHAKQSYFGKLLLPLVEKERRIVVGGIAPDFQMETPEGEYISLQFKIYVC